MKILVVNESKIVRDESAAYITKILNYQAVYHFGRSGWRSDVRCEYVGRSDIPRIPVGSSILHILDTADEPGALGYHDEDGNEVPYARVFAQTSLDAGDRISEVMSHELLEIAVDPHINDSCLNPATSQLWAKEVGDPCQGNAYDVGEAFGKPTGVMVADFVLPNFFDPNTPASAATDFRGALHGSFALGPQGYYSYIDLRKPSAGWQQKVGAERTSAPSPDRDDRIARRYGRY